MIVILVLLVIFYIYMINKICNNLEYFTYTSPNFQKDIDKTVLIIGATHGNEPAGYHAIKNLMNDMNSNKIKYTGRLILIPAVNYCALQMKLRFIPFIGDLNRKYPSSIERNPSNTIIKEIINFVSQADFVLDFHEGYDFNRRNNNSMGSTLTTSNIFSLNLANEIVIGIDKTINEDYKKFRIYTAEETLIKSNPDLYQKQNVIKGSLSYYAKLINKNYILVETSGQDNIQPIEDRVKQDRFIIDFIIQKILVPL